MTIAIIDDEQHCIDRILMLLQPYKEKINIITYKTLQAAKKGINLRHPEIIFLDIKIHDHTGFDLLKVIDAYNFNLIFTTAYEKYAVNAFKFSAIDYLLKPINVEDFEIALQKAFRKIEKESLSEKINVLLSQFSKDRPSKISIYTQEGYMFLTLSEILYCQSDVNYTHIYTTSGKKYTVSKTLKQFDELLSESNFFRIHNSYLINMEHIKKYTKKGFVTLSNGISLEISTRRREIFFKEIKTIFSK